MLDIIASDLFKKYMPPITSMRLRCKQTPRLVQSFNDWNSMKDGPSDGPGASIGPDEGRQCLPSEYERNTRGKDNGFVISTSSSEGYFSDFFFKSASFQAQSGCHATGRFNSHRLRILGKCDWLVKYD
jgi:hypothetical protein